MRTHVKTLATAGLLALSLYSAASSAHGRWRHDYDGDDDWRGYPAQVVREYYSPPPRYYQPPTVVVQQPVIVEERYYAPPPPPPPPPVYYGGYGRNMAGGVIGGAIGAAAGYQLGYGDPVAMGLGAMAGALLGHELTE